MPCDLRFTLTLATADGLPRPNARMWLDLSADYALDDGEEVALTSIDRATWIGIRHLDDRDDAEGLFFVLRFVAPEGVAWSFKATCGDDLVYQTQDGLKTGHSRETLTGTLRRREPSSTPAAPGGRPAGGA